MSLLLEFLSVDVLVNGLFSRILTPFIQNVSSIDWLLVRQMSIFISPLELVIRHVGMVVNVVIVIMNVFPGQLPVRFLKEPMVQVETSLPLPVLEPIRHYFIHVPHLIVALHVSIDIVVSVEAWLFSRLQMSQQNVLSASLEQIEDFGVDFLGAAGNFE